MRSSSARASRSKSPSRREARSDVWSLSITGSASPSRTWSGSSSGTSRRFHRGPLADWGSASTLRGRSSTHTVGPSGSKPALQPDRRSPAIYRGAPRPGTTHTQVEKAWLRAMTKFILIVEDDRDLSRLVAEVLDCAGYRTAIAANGY